MKEKTEIIDCALPLHIQKLYIKRLKHMIEMWEFENFCEHCPINKKYAIYVSPIKELNGYSRLVCDFCTKNVSLDHFGYRCPCRAFGPKKALKRAKDFIRRFDLKYSTK